MIDIRVPRINQSATDAVLIDWKVEPGETVSAGQVVALIETDKSEIEVESPADEIQHMEAALAATHGDTASMMPPGARQSPGTGSETGAA